MSSAVHLPAPPPAEHRAPHRVGDPWRHILVATEGDPDSVAPVARALELARRDGADLTILVAQPVEGPGLSRERPISRAIEVLIERGRAAGLVVTVETRHGAAGRAIVDAAREVSADLVVVGRHGRPLDMPAYAATCGYVLTHSDRPVLVVQPWAPQEATR